MRNLVQRLMSRPPYGQLHRKVRIEEADEGEVGASAGVCRFHRGLCILAQAPVVFGLLIFVRHQPLEPRVAFLAQAQVFNFRL